MYKQPYTPEAEELLNGLQIIELEERLEMVHLSAIEAEVSTRCDTDGPSGSGCVDVPEVVIN